MKLTEEIKNKISEEYTSFKEDLYAGKSLEERKELDQFFTPPELTIQMIEKMDCESLENRTILDPTCGSGNLLIACLIAGAKMENIYGNDYDSSMIKICRDRLRKYIRSNNIKVSNEEHVYSRHIHRGNAMQKMCLIDFGENYNKYYNEEYIDDLDYAQGKHCRNSNGERMSVAECWIAENKFIQAKHNSPTDNSPTELTIFSPTESN